MASSKTKGANTANKKESIASSSDAESEPQAIAMVDDAAPHSLASPTTYTTPKKRARQPSTKHARKRAKQESAPCVVEAFTPSVADDANQDLDAIEIGNLRHRISQVVTPVGEDEESTPNYASVANEEEEVVNRKPKARRALRMDESQPAAPVTPSPLDRGRNRLHGSGHTPTAKRKLLFGRQVSPIQVGANVENIYTIVKKHTGSLGGNAIGGAIYGELTMGSMQKMINLMKQHTNFNADSIFVDVGSGIGKPNLHVAQDPGVQASIGIEMDADRYLLGMTCLKAVLDAAMEQQQPDRGEQQPHVANLVEPSSAAIASKDVIGTKCFFIHGNIMDASTMDPFTHVYMFSIGFPPTLWRHLATIFNRSSSPYLICYHSSKDIIQKYEFDVELIAQTPTSMHGSKEGHTGYIYQRLTTSAKVPARSASTTRPCDGLFKPSFDLIKAGLIPLKDAADLELQARLSSQSVTRSRARSTRANAAGPS